MIFRFYAYPAGAHVRIKLFAGQALGSLGLAGWLTLRAEEWLDLKVILMRGGVAHALTELDGVECVEACTRGAVEELLPCMIR